MTTRPFTYIADPRVLRAIAAIQEPTYKTLHNQVINMLVDAAMDAPPDMMVALLAEARAWIADYRIAPIVYEDEPELTEAYERIHLDLPFFLETLATFKETCSPPSETFPQPFPLGGRMTTINPIIPPTGYDWPTVVRSPDDRFPGLARMLDAIGTGESLVLTRDGGFWTVKGPGQRGAP